MGNRAVITTRENFYNNGIGIYLHWNGGRDSVQAFLKYCELRNFRSPNKDNYGWARLCQVIANFFGGEGSVGIDVVNNLDCNNGDNGVYIIKDWEIIGREHSRGIEQTSHKLDRMLIAIDDSQPQNERLGDFLLSKEIDSLTLKIGDTVFAKTWEGKYKKAKVIGFGKHERVNGRDVTGVPYVDLYNIDDCSRNINNYIFDKRIRIANGKGEETC